MYLPPDEVGLVRARSEIRCRGEPCGKRPENNPKRFSQNHPRIAGGTGGLHGLWFSHEA
jgi:hypothetical protein